MTIRLMKGQTILIIILVMTVALAIGLSVVQRSLTDVSTASRVEESARAFSAAEAGVERALQSGGGATTVTISETQSSAQVTDSGLLPAPPAVNVKQVALEFRPPLTKEDVAHIWLSDPNSSTNPPATYYKRSDLDIYWGLDGVADNEKPAIEIKIVYYDTSVIPAIYNVKRYYFDSKGSREIPNGFTDASANCTGNQTSDTIFGTGIKFLCKTTITGLPSNLMILRARILYSSYAHPFAVQPTSGCGVPVSDCSLPSQMRILESLGTAGETQRKVQVTRQDKVVPFYFDYAIFSAGQISK